MRQIVLVLRSSPMKHSYLMHNQSLKEEFLTAVVSFQQTRYTVLLHELLLNRSYSREGGRGPIDSPITFSWALSHAIISAACIKVHVAGGQKQ